MLWANVLTAPLWLDRALLVPASLVDLAIAQALTSKASFPALPLAGWLRRAAGYWCPPRNIRSHFKLEAPLPGQRRRIALYPATLGEIEAIGSGSHLS